MSAMPTVANTRSHHWSNRGPAICAIRPFSSQDAEVAEENASDADPTRWVNALVRFLVLVMRVKFPCVTGCLGRSPRAPWWWWKSFPPWRTRVRWSIFLKDWTLLREWAGPAFAGMQCSRFALFCFVCVCSLLATGFCSWSTPYPRRGWAPFWLRLPPGRTPKQLWATTTKSTGTSSSMWAEQKETARSNHWITCTLVKVHLYIHVCA